MTSFQRVFPRLSPVTCSYFKSDWFIWISEFIGCARCSYYCFSSVHGKLLRECDIIQQLRHTFKLPLSITAKVVFKFRKNGQINCLNRKLCSYDFPRASHTLHVLLEVLITDLATQCFEKKTRCYSHSLYLKSLNRIKLDS